MFCKRHYEAVAEVMQEAWAKAEQDADRQAQCGLIERLLSEMFHRDNPQFNRTRFLHACVPGANVRARA